MSDNQKEKVVRLAQVRKALKLSQEGMATILGIPRTSLSKIENIKDNRDVPYGTKYILQVELNVNPGWFENGIGEMFLEKKSPDIRSNSEEERSLKDKIIELQEEIIQLHKDLNAVKSKKNNGANDPVRSV